MTDAKGRVLKVRKLNAIERFRLFKAAGPETSENRLAMSYASSAAAVVEINGEPIPFPSTPLQLEALITRLDEDGLVAALKGVVALIPSDEDVVSEVKNS